jgi:choline dehydrogenase-like flavoprotein
MDAYDAIITGTGRRRGALARQPSGKRSLLLERRDWLMRELPLAPARLHEERDPVAGCAHQAGTCRFGMDPVTSALNTGCRAQLDNLYVVDTSVFPNIGAENPGLTAMANALRVGDHLLTRLA